MQRGRAHPKQSDRIWRLRRGWGAQACGGCGFEPQEGVLVRTGLPCGARIYSCIAREPVFIYFLYFLSKMFEMFEYILLGLFSIFRKLFLRTAPLFSLNRHCLQCALRSTSLVFALSLCPCAGTSITAVIDGTKVLAVLRKCSNSRNMLTLYCIPILVYCKFCAVGSALCPGAVVTIRSSVLRNSTVRRF